MDYSPRPRTDFIAVHASDTPPSMNVDEYEIRQWHLERNWADIGYNIVIPRDATVQVGRPLDYCGAHVRGYNYRSLGICLVGGRSEDGQPEDNYTEDQYGALRDTLIWLRRYAPGALTQGHRDFPNVHKACPCFDVRGWMESVGLSNTVPRR